LLVIRPYCRRDIRAMVALEAQSMLINAQRVPELSPRCIDAPALRRYLGRMLGRADQRWFVADLGGRRVGQIGAEQVTVGHRHAPQRRYVYLHSLFVATDARRLGIGRALTRYALAWARRRGLRQVRLEMAAANRSAEQLYRSLGLRIREVLWAGSIGAGS
jgi:ribosomal protein S18 acetylase RimI-like enzyme